MDRATKIKVFLSCMGFLGLIYGLASLDQGHRKQVDQEITTMKEYEENEKKQDAQEAEQKIMYLTFDDGPSKNTQAVLDILKKYDIKATFFVTGENPEYAGMIKTIHDQGHALGIHTYSHEYSKIYTSEDAYFQDIEKVNNLIKDQADIETHLLRFPGGSSNTVSRNYGPGIMTVLASAVQEKGYEYYDWNAHNGDGDPGLSSSELYDRAMKEIKGKTNVIMLMHDGTGNKNTVNSLDDVLQSMIKQGWEFRIIEEGDSVAVYHHKIAN